MLKFKSLLGSISKQPILSRGFASRSCGIVGLPNVGKSTLFNALTNTQKAEASNFPFCTIEPNVGLVSVPDPRLAALAKLANSGKIISTQVEFMDIAGLVKGASKGEGLGNQFLGNIRSTNVVLQLVRCYHNDDITHVDNSIDPLRDIDVIETELMLADIDVVEKRKANMSKKLAQKDKDVLHSVLNKCFATLQDGKLVSDLPATHFNAEENVVLQSLQLLTAKKFLYLCNVDENSVVNGNDLSDKVKQRAESQGKKSIHICAKLEEEASMIGTEEEKQELLAEYGLKTTGLQQVIKAAFDLLDLQLFYTVGPMEARAWIIPKGSTAPEAASVIHTDLQKGFVRAETISYDDYVTCGGESKAKEKGKMRLEGKEYIAKDGDIFHFRSSL